jgi:hypothetical protein
MLVKSGGDNGVGFNEATQSWLRGHSVKPWAEGRGQIAGHAKNGLGCDYKYTALPVR